MANPTSISAKDIATAVKTAVDKNPKLKGVAAGDLSIGSFRPPIIGFILNEAEIAVAQADALATSVAQSLPSAKGAQPACLIHNGHIICGYIIDPSITAFKTAE